MGTRRKKASSGHASKRPRLIADFGNNRVASLLGVSPSHRRPAPARRGGGRAGDRCRSPGCVRLDSTACSPGSPASVRVRLGIRCSRGRYRARGASIIPRVTARCTPQLLQGRRDFAGSVRAIAELDAEKVDVLDLDDARELVRRRLRPSGVVTRDRTMTQRWALDIFKEKRWAGVRWWSRYDSRWGSFGRWALAEVRALEVTRLTADHPALIEAAAILSRPWSEVS
jgi:hypothetical protein